MSPELYAAYLAACVVLVLVPGPTVTLTIANSLKHGTRAGLLSVAGTQLGLAAMLAIVGVGLTSLVEAMIFATVSKVEAIPAVPRFEGRRTVREAPPDLRVEDGWQPAARCIRGF